MSTSLQLFNSKVAIDNYNDDFLILKPENRSETRKIGSAIFHNKFDFVEEVIVTEVEICVKLNTAFDALSIGLFKDIELQEGGTRESYRLPVYFNDHEDWKQVELTTGYAKNEIISKLVATDFSIAMFGFLPGFIYIDGLDESLHVPRKAVPSKYVKAKSIAIGGKYLGVYSLDSPGGWHVIGSVPVSVLQIPDLPPVVLNPGDQIKLHPIEQAEYDELLVQALSLKEYNARFRDH